MGTARRRDGRNASRYARTESRGSRAAPSSHRSTAGCPRATPNAGGSITVNEASASMGAREQRDDASVGVPDEVIARLDHAASQTASWSKSTRSTGGFGGNPGRLGNTSSKREASGSCRGHERAAFVTLPCRRTRRGRVTNLTLAADQIGKTGVTSGDILRTGDTRAPDVLPRRRRQRPDRIHGSVHRRSGP